jgi:hypothetical protein
MLAIEIGALTELLLVVIDSLKLLKTGVLPLGGGAIEQLGIVFGLSYVTARLIDILRRK